MTEKNTEKRTDQWNEKIKEISKQVETLSQVAKMAIGQGLGNVSKVASNVGQQVLTQLSPLEETLHTWIEAASQHRLRQVPVKVKKLEHFTGELPQYQSAWASGFDLVAQLPEPMELKPLERALVPTGLVFEIPPGYEVQVRPRSGRAFKEGLSVPNAPGTIDADYRGEVKVIVVNLSNASIWIRPQERIAQGILCPIYQAQFEEVVELSETHRGQGGFGHTGK